MYRPPVFDEPRIDVLVAAMRAYPLGLLVRNGPEGLTADLIPFLLADDDGSRRLLGHVSRGNPLWREVRAAEPVLVAFSGPEHYVSPSWYATKAATGKVVPTWNYVVVEAHGTIHVHDDAEWTGRQIRALTEAQESTRSEPWGVDDAPAEFLAQQVRGIVGIEIVVDRLAGKWKVSQNRTEADRAGVAAGLTAEASGEAAAMAALVAARIAPESGS
ncbi:MAG: FMN-binding negative transcriptional regulator [Ancalomicrobiaceae bacterium]|nr:FMN-binding negative transcriptional regulator [Ancalomicrobiaceae bacterium]